MIQVVDPTAFEPTFDPKYAVLGYLNEYMGRDTGPEFDAAAGIKMISEDPRRTEVVERFYPAEGALVPGFCAALTAWGAREGVVLTPEVVVGQQGHHVVYDAPAYELINSCYAGAERVGLRGFAVVHEGMFPDAPRPQRRRLPPEFANARFSYLLGCHRRYGNGSEFRFANAVPKVDLVVEFLEQIGCEWIQREWWTQRIPRMTTVRFQPTATLAAWLGIDEDATDS